MSEPGYPQRQETGNLQSRCCPLRLSFGDLEPLRVLFLVHPLVLCEMVFLDKAFPTLRARERLLSGVIALVPYKVRLLAEALPALAALVRPLPSVNALVDGENGPGHKAFPTLIANVLLLLWRGRFGDLPVHALLGLGQNLRQCPWLHNQDWLPTDVARLGTPEIWAAAEQGTHRCRQVLRLATGGTRLLFHVARPLVHCEVSLGEEGLSAGVTLNPLCRRMGALVLHKVLLLGEAFATLGAYVRPLATVEPEVAHQVGFLREALPALRTGKRLLSGVDTLVDAEGGPPGEALPAFAADKLLHPPALPLGSCHPAEAHPGLFPLTGHRLFVGLFELLKHNLLVVRMDAAVEAQDGLDAEAPLALRAGVGLGPGPDMGPLMLDKVLLLTETPLAPAAPEGPLARVVAQVAQQVGLLAEAPPTHLALEGLLPSMDPPMDVQRRPPGKTLPTLFAAEVSFWCVGPPGRHPPSPAPKGQQIVIQSLSCHSLSLLAVVTTASFNAVVLLCVPVLGSSAPEGAIPSPFNPMETTTFS